MLDSSQSEVQDGSGTNDDENETNEDDVHLNILFLLIF
jgi:hypothetical protein